MKLEAELWWKKKQVKVKYKIVCEKLKHLHISITDVYKKNEIIWILANPQILMVYTLEFLKSSAAGS